MAKYILCLLRPSFQQVLLFNIIQPPISHDPEVQIKYTCILHKMFISFNSTIKHSRNYIFKYIILVYYLFVCLFVVVQVQLSPFSPHHAPLCHPSFPPTLEPTPFGFVHMSFIHVPWQPFSYSLLLSFFPLLYGYCQFVRYFNMLVVFCLLICLLIRFHL